MYTQNCCYKYNELYHVAINQLSPIYVSPANMPAIIDIVMHGVRIKSQNPYYYRPKHIYRITTVQRNTLMIEFDDSKGCYMMYIMFKNDRIVQIR